MKAGFLEEPCHLRGTSVKERDRVFGKEVIRRKIVMGVSGVIKSEVIQMEGAEEAVTEPTTTGFQPGNLSAWNPGRHPSPGEGVGAAGRVH